MQYSSSPPVFEPTGREGMNLADIADMFSNAASCYESGWAIRGYNVYKTVAEKVADFFPEKSMVKILDVAAGTGLVAQERQGFRQIDGLDPAEGMKDEAMKKKIYTEYFVEFMTGETTPGIQTDAYDGVTVSGGFNNGLLPCPAVLEMARVVKPGGLICFAVFDSIFSEVEEYKGRLGPLMKAMGEAGVWQLLDTTSLYEMDMQTLYRYVVKTSEIPYNNNNNNSIYIAQYPRHKGMLKAHGLM